MQLGGMGRVVEKSEERVEEDAMVGRSARRENGGVGCRGEGERKWRMIAVVELMAMATLAMFTRGVEFERGESL